MILLDENIDEALVGSMPDLDVRHVVGMGWQGAKNGALMAKAAEAGFTVFLTADKNMPYQQSMKGRPFMLVVLDIHPNTIENQIACLEQIREWVCAPARGTVHVIRGPHSRRKPPIA